jgi:multiple sugar transport system substrate-binding protein
MPTKYFMLIILCVLSLLGLVAVMTIPEEDIGDKIPLVFATGSNAQRQKEIDLFHTMYPQDHVVIDANNNSVMKVIVQSCANMGPDLIDGIFGWNIETYLDAGVLWDITDYAAEMGFGPETLPATVRPLVMMKVLDDDGNIVTRQFSYPCNVYHKFIIYNKTVFDKYKVPYPSEDLTWEEYIRLAQKLTIYRNKNDKLPQIFGAAGPVPESIVWEMGGDFLNKAGTRCLLDSKEVVDAMVFYHDIFYKHKIAPTPTQVAGVAAKGGAGSSFITWLADGKLAMYPIARYAVGDLRLFASEQQKRRNEWLKSNPDAKDDEGPQVYKYGACLMPRFADGKRYVKFDARCAGINRNSANRKEALNYLQFLASKPYSDLINMAADCKPGNKKYNTLKEMINPHYPGEEQIHEMSLASVPFGRGIPRSMFVSNATISRNFKLIIDKIETDPDLGRAEISRTLQRITSEIDLEIARNIKRSNSLSELYGRLLKDGIEPIRLKIEEIN